MRLNNWNKRCTLKLEILVDFPASANVLFTHFTMMSSFTFSPSPSSSSTFKVYLQKWRGSRFIAQRNCGLYYILTSLEKKGDDKGKGDCIISKKDFLSFYVSPSHQLPHQRQSQGRVAVIQVLPTDANKGELGCFAQFHCIVTVLQLKGM